jgi:predicted GTPase
VVAINKLGSADAEGIESARRNIASEAPDASVIDAASTLDVDAISVMINKKVLVVEYGPTLTHGEIKIGAAGLVDPQPFIVGRLCETFETYPEIETVLSATGYGEQHLNDLETTINNAECDTVVMGTPIDLNRIIKIDKPNTRVHYTCKKSGARIWIWCWMIS